MNSYMPASIESGAGFRVLFECATISILVVNEKGSLELSNPCAEKLFDYNPDELLGKPIEALIPECLRHKRVQHRETYFAKPNARHMGLGNELLAFSMAKNTGSIEDAGLGLTKAKRYVELRDGDMNFNTKDGVGTTFFIKITLR